MPKLAKSSGSRRSRSGDFLAVLLLAAIIVTMGWLWWHGKHSQKASHHQTSAPAQPAIPAILHALPAGVKTANVRVDTLASTNAATPTAIQSSSGFPRPVRNLLEAQVALARNVISPGCIDSANGSQTRAAITAFQRSEGLDETGILDTNTRIQLTIDSPVMTTYTVTSNDLAELQPLGKTWLAKSKQTSLAYETVQELVAEKFHAHILLVKKMNPTVDWDHIAPGTILNVPDVAYPDPDDKAAWVVIHLSDKYLEAFDTSSNLIAHFPCSIAARVEKRPVGELHVYDIAKDPDYTFDPALFPESPEAQQIGHKLKLPPGPNNPVGVAWVGLDKPGYGIHGTPVPEQVGRTESHGCFRLANWDAAYFLKLAWVGLPVEVVP